MIAMILVHPHIFWLSLGGLLLAAEMLGGNGYLLWSGVAAVITGLTVWLLPLGWEWQCNAANNFGLIHNQFRIAILAILDPELSAFFAKH